MDLIVDANILFAALIKEGVTAKLMFVDRLHLYAPEFLLEEFEKYRKEILKKTHRSSENFEIVLSEISARIHLVPKNEFNKMINVAEEISPDINDSIYFALALKFGMPIWSNETRLKKQSTIRIYSTSDLIHIFSADLEQ
jgi:predicted nucleic acid-binding protein